MGHWKAIGDRHVRRSHVAWLYTNGNPSGYCPNRFNPGQAESFYTSDPTSTSSTSEESDGDSEQAFGGVSQHAMKLAN